MTMAAATTTMRSIRAPSKALILALVICIRSCISFQISYSSRKTTASRQWQKKSSHQTSTPTTQSIAAIHHHYRLPPPRILRSTKSVDDKDCDCSDGNSIGNSGHNDNNNNAEPLLLQPYLPAMDSNYPTRGPIGLDKFVISRSGPPTIEELSNEQMLRIVQLECSDLEVNTLVWKCLGYRFDTETQSWLNTECFPKWKDQFPTPPDLIGMKRVYSREVDSPSLRSNQALVRSIPVDNKQSLKAHLKPLGWKGYQYKELTPNKTRRAQCANWLIYYREELFGYTIEELSERRRLKREAAEKAAAEAAAAAEEEASRERGEEGESKVPDDWKPPVKEVF